jgi:murein DD-endopeptidase MepM/ murein hydrolase activator NlpD
VLYSDNKLSNYGNVIIIDHGSGAASVYAHNRCNLVKACQTVTRGQQIAMVGQTGNATTPHVHFEIRNNTKPTNPRPLLP